MVVHLKTLLKPHHLSSLLKHQIPSHISSQRRFSTQFNIPSSTKKESIETTNEFKNKNHEVSSAMWLFIHILHEKGYLGNIKLLPKVEFDRYLTKHGDWIRKAAERFGADHPDIAKCLSENDVKRLAIFGCPSLEKKTVFAARRLRAYFSVEEKSVCRLCKLNHHCNLKYHPGGKKYDNFDVADVLKILTTYALEFGPPELTLSDEIKDTMSNLFTQVVHECQVVAHSHELKKKI
ncbi:hypothetical protein ACHQM5_018294 [Ranunculus cassubicifolius]